MPSVDITGENRAIEIGATGLVQIIQNVKIILTTVKGSVPLDRDFGVSGAIIDAPLPIAMARRVADIVEAVERDEPRVTVESVTWGQSSLEAMDGRAVPTVRIRVKDGVDPT